MVRMYLAGHRFAHIPECLYGYRVHKLNTVRTDNAAIRQATERVYNKYIWALAEKFAQDGGFSKVDLCGGIDNPPSYEPYDLTLGHDLNKTWPIPDNSVGVLRAYDAVEHLRDNVFTMNESFRVLTPGGFMCISVPSTDGRGAWQDSSHVSFWNQNTMFYWTDRRFARYLPEFKGRFAVSRVITWFPSDWHREFQCPYVEAQLIKLGAPYEHMGPAPI